MSWKPLESAFCTSAGALWSVVSFWIAVLAAAIFWTCGCTASQTCLAQGSSLSSLLLLPLLHADSASTSTAPPDSAAVSFLFTGLVPSVALGPGTYTSHGRRPYGEFPI